MASISYGAFRRVRGGCPTKTRLNLRVDFPRERKEPLTGAAVRTGGPAHV